VPGALGVPAKVPASRGGCNVAIVGSAGVYVVVRVKEEFGQIRFRS
jgi:hypothetical protein